MQFRRLRLLHGMRSTFYNYMKKLLPFLLILVSPLAAQQLSPYAFTAPVEDERLLPIMERDGRLTPGHKEATSVLNAYFFETPLTVEECHQKYPDSNTPLGAYATFRLSHDPAGGINDTIEFYIPEERKQLQERWKRMAWEFDQKWPGQCDYSRIRIKGIVEGNAVVYILLGRGRMQMKKIDDRWYIQSMPEDDFIGWLLFNANEKGSIEPVSSYSSGQSLRD